MIKSNIDNLSLEELSSDAELIPLMTPEDEEQIEQEPLPEKLAILTLRNTVLFPGVVIPIAAGRDKSVKLIESVSKDSKTFGVVAQKNAEVEDPNLEDLYHTGVVARILKVLKMPDGNITVIIQGKKRFEIKEVETTEPYIVASVSELKDVKPSKKDAEFTTIIDSIRELSLKIIKESPNIPSDAAFAIKNIESDSFLVNFISSNLNLSKQEKQQLLEINNLKKRALSALKFLNVEYKKLQLKNTIQNKVQNDLSKQQRDYFLHQQIKTIQEELGGVSHEGEIQKMREDADAKNWKKETRDHFEKEVLKFQRMSPQMPDYSVQRNYLELFLELPWNTYSKDHFNLKKAEKILDKHHYGLDEVKKRIIEYLAVLKLRNDMKSPIICLYGPPGVGKTSLGKSIAEALGRKYVRMSLGGVHDESEIRGHRKTYIGAMPGRILQNLKKAGTSNPVFVLDEIDKLGQRGGNGDPSSALLEVLDPEQNESFYDNFLEVGFDLSKVLFIATSNNMGAIHPALRDRMEVIHVSGYTIEEKVEIARKYLVKKQLKNHGLKSTDLKISKLILEKIVEGHTRESGVRGLDKQIAKISRSIAKNIATQENYDPKLNKETLKEILGAPRLERDKYENNNTAGVVTGLAWTQVGGDILFIESLLSKGKGQLSITGNLGKVMKESATIALEFLKSNYKKYDIDPELFEKCNVHIHVPEGATPKDGPSAGITILTSLVSLFTQRKVKNNLAMSGEITLRGKVLPVGGIKEKILAAKRAGITDIILCHENKRDIEKINQDYLKGLTFNYVKEMKEVIDYAVTSQKVTDPFEL